MLSLFKLGSILLATASIVLGDVVGNEATLTLTSKTISPDGFHRRASVINGVHPGPIVSIKKGDSVKLNVVNDLTDRRMILGTTIHWHGMFQRRTNFMDGVNGVTQCPIAPNNSFLYTFDTDQTGTYWYHSHFGIQYCDGIRGAFIIYDDEDPLKQYYDVDDESTVISLTEWYHQLAVDIQGIPEADATLINGKGRFPTGPKADLAVINVEQGKRYRFRILSMSCEPNFTFSVDGHELMVIEVDGTATKPYTVNSIQLFTGQRYSAVLNANQTIDNYWIRSLPNFGARNLSTTFEGGVNSAILRYKGADIAEPTTEQQKKKIPLIETELHPAVPDPVPGKHSRDGADVDIDLTFGFNPKTFLFNVNGNPYKPPTVPVLLQILSRAKPPQKLLPKGSVIELPRNKTVQLNFPAGLIGGPHPFHLHGHPFWVVRNADSGTYNFEDPIVRDVVNAGDNPGDYVSIRFRTDNPGPWLFHCHIDFHLQEGLAVVFAEAKNETKSYQDTPPEEWDELCPTWDDLPDIVKFSGLHHKP